MVVLFKDNEIFINVRSIFRQRKSENFKDEIVQLKSGLEPSSSLIPIDARYLLKNTFFQDIILSRGGETDVETENEENMIKKLKEKPIEIYLSSRIINLFSRLFKMGQMNVDDMNLTEIDEVLEGGDLFQIESVIINCLDLKRKESSSFDLLIALKFAEERQLLFMDQIIPKWIVKHEEPVKIMCGENYHQEKIKMEKIDVKQEQEEEMDQSQESQEEFNAPVQQQQQLQNQEKKSREEKNNLEKQKEEQENKKLEKLKLQKEEEENKKLEKLKLQKEEEENKKLEKLKLQKEEKSKKLLQIEELTREREEAKNKLEKEQEEKNHFLEQQKSDNKNNKRRSSEEETPKKRGRPSKKPKLTKSMVISSSDSDEDFYSIITVPSQDLTPDKSHQITNNPIIANISTINAKNTPKTPNPDKSENVAKSSKANNSQNINSNHSNGKIINSKDSTSNSKDLKSSEKKTPQVAKKAHGLGNNSDNKLNKEKEKKNQVPEPVKLNQVVPSEINTNTTLPILSPSLLISKVSEKSAPPPPGENVDSEVDIITVVPIKQIVAPDLSDSDRSSSSETVILEKSNSKMPVLSSTLNTPNGVVYNFSNYKPQNGLNILFMGEDRILYAYNLLKKEHIKLTKNPVRASKPKIVFEPNNKLIVCIGGEKRSERTKKVKGTMNTVLTIPLKGIKTEAWTETKKMSLKKCDFEAIILENIIFTFGGLQDSKHQCNAIEVFDMVKNEKWIDSFPHHMDFFREKFGIANIDKVIYIVGGLGEKFKENDEKGENPKINPEALDSVEEYHTVKQNVKILNPMIEKRIGVSCAVVNKKVYAVGGMGPDGKFKNTVEVYDPLKNQWTFCYSLNQPRSAGSVFVHDGHIFAIGGNEKNVPPSIEIYNPIKDLWQLFPSKLPIMGIYESVVNLIHEF